MTIDPAFHVIDPDHGFAVDKEDGHIVGLMPKPAGATGETVAEFPKWVVPHDSHVERTPHHVVVRQFPHFHVNRAGGEVTVMVADAEEEAKALAPMVEVKAEQAPDPDGKPATGDQPGPT